MKRILFGFVISVSFGLLGQEAPVLGSGNSSSLSKNTSLMLKYHEEIPDKSTYEIVKNETKTDVTEDILKRINFYRKQNANYLWVVNKQIEILIYPQE